MATCLVGVCVSAEATRAQGGGARYRDYALGDSVAAVVEASGVRDPLPRTLHERPERLQTLERRARYAYPSDGNADPVRDLQFSFVGNQLYRLQVHYDRDRTFGLTSADLVEVISAAYGASPEAPGPRAAIVHDVAGDMAVVRQWPLPEATLTLFAGMDTPDYMLVLESTALGVRAATATQEAARLDRLEAPKRASDARTKEVRDSQDVKERARAKNKPAFRP